MKSNVVRVVKYTAIMAVVCLLAACLPEDGGKPNGDSQQGQQEQRSFREWIETVTDPSAVKDCFFLIKIAGPTDNRRWVFAPKACGVCKNPKDDCGDTVTWRLVSLPSYLDGATVHVEGKQNEPPCFGAVDLGNPPESKTETVNAGAQCPVGWDWEFTVSCEEKDGKECLPPLDPMVRILN